MPRGTTNTFQYSNLLEIITVHKSISSVLALYGLLKLEMQHIEVGTILELRIGYVSSNRPTHQETGGHSDVSLLNKSRFEEIHSYCNFVAHRLTLSLVPGSRTYCIIIEIWLGTSYLFSSFFFVLKFAPAFITGFSLTLAWKVEIIHFLFSAYTNWQVNIVPECFPVQLVRYIGERLPVEIFHRID